MCTAAYSRRGESMVSPKAGHEPNVLLDGNRVFECTELDPMRVAQICFCVLSLP